MTTQPLRAHVKNGRLVLDEPTQLPEGEVVYLQLVDGLVAQGDDLHAAHHGVGQRGEQPGVGAVR